MYTIHANSVNIKDLPEIMLCTIKHHQELGDLDGLIHAKDDVIEIVADYGFDMLSFWDTPDPEVVRKLSRSMVYEECLEKATDLLYDLLHKCKSCVVLPEINIVLTEIDELLKDLE